MTSDKARPTRGARSASSQLQGSPARAMTCSPITSPTAGVASYRDSTSSSCRSAVLTRDCQPSMGRPPKTASLRLTSRSGSPPHEWRLGRHPGRLARPSLRSSCPRQSWAQASPAASPTQPHGRQTGSLCETGLGECRASATSRRCDTRTRNGTTALLAFKIQFGDRYPTEQTPPAQKMGHPPTRRWFDRHARRRPPFSTTASLRSSALPVAASARRAARGSG
jgi:hypothetical protein